MDRFDQLKILLVHLLILLIGQFMMAFFMEITRQVVILQDKIPPEVLQGKTFQELSEYQKEVEKKIQEEMRTNPTQILQRFMEIVIHERNGIFLWLNIAWALSYLLTGYLIIHKKMGIPVSKLEDPFSWRWVGLGGYYAVGLFFFYSLVGIVIHFYGIELKNSEFQTMVFQNLHGNTKLFVWSLYSLALITGILEEWFFRGFLLKHYMEKNLTNEGWILTSVLFGVMHYSHDSSLIIPGLLIVAGFVFGYLYIQYRSIWVSISCHAIFNGINLTVAYLFGKMDL